MFFSAPEADRSTVEAVIAGVGLRPIYVGADEEASVDPLFRLWIALAIKQGRGIAWRSASWRDEVAHGAKQHGG